MWTEALDMASAISQEVVTVTHDGMQRFGAVLESCVMRCGAVSCSGSLSHHGDAEGPRPSSAEPLYVPWHFLYFFPLPQGQGSLRPTLSSLR